MIDIQTRFNSGVLENALNKFEKGVKDSVLLSGVAASAKVIYNEVKANAEKTRKREHCLMLFIVCIAKIIQEAVFMFIIFQ